MNMTADVRTLSIVPRAPALPEPQPNVVTFIEGLLARAKAGEIQSIAVTYAAENGHPCDGYSRGNREIDTFILAAGVLCLSAKIADILNSTETTCPAPEERT